MGYDVTSSSGFNDSTSSNCTAGNGSVATSPGLNHVETVDGLPEVPVFGLGTYIFPAIHVTAMSTLSVTAVVSFLVIVNVFYNSKRNFFSIPIGQRLVVYLAVCDLGFALSHGSDHVFIYAVENNTPEPSCTIIAWFVAEFTLGQSLVVNVAAVTAVAYIVFGSRPSFGKYDWRVILYAFGLPAVTGTIPAVLGYMGAVGAWCFMDVRKPGGRVLNSFYIIAIISVFVINSVCYFVVWIKVKQVGMLMKDFQDKTAQEASQRSKRTAQSMALIVLAYLFQWCLYVSFTLWQFFGNPRVELLIADVVVCNLGGVFSAIAYTLMKKFHERSNDPKSKEKVVSSLPTVSSQID